METLDFEEEVRVGSEVGEVDGGQVLEGGWVWGYRGENGGGEGEG